MNYFLLSTLLVLISCTEPVVKEVQDAAIVTQDSIKIDKAKVIHVLVALCDNKNQGIVPVPKAIGNGQDPANNLYWGCAGGVKTFFKKSPNWRLLNTVKNPSTNILERCVFKHVATGAYLIADAYDGASIKECTIDFFDACAGGSLKIIKADNKNLGFGGYSNLVAYIGHDGLMDFGLYHYEQKKNDDNRDAIMLACKSKNYFQFGIRQSGANPILWSTGLMSPEAYTLEAALEGWLKKETPQDIQKRAAAAYHKYQRCGMKGAMNLLVTGW